MSRSDPLIRRLADANPVPMGEVEGASRSSAADELLTAFIGREPRPLGGPPVTRRRRVAVAGVLLASLVVVAVVLRVVGERPASASELLLRTAAVAGDRQAPVQGGGYLYSRIETDRLTTSDQGGLGWSAVVRVVEERWISADGSGRILLVPGPSMFFGPRDSDRWEEAGEPTFVPSDSDSSFPTGTLAYEDSSLLPTSRSGLDWMLRDGVSSEGLPADVAVFIRVGELLARGDASPALRAALYRVAANLPGVELVGEATDPKGRQGVAVSMTYDESGAAVEVVMIFDADTSALIAQETILLERASWVDAAPGTRLSFVVYLEAGWTDSVTQTPTLSAA